MTEPRLKTEEEVKRDHLRAAAKIRDLARSSGDTEIAEMPLSEIVEPMLAALKRLGLGDSQE